MLLSSALPAVWLLLLLLQGASAEPSKDPTYLLTVTSQPVGGSRETVCVHVFPKKTISLEVTLEHDGSRKSLLVENFIMRFYYRCIYFQVPSVLVESEAGVNVQIKGENTLVNKTTKILIKPAAYLTIIQLDKPIYKPGQTIRFRIVSLDSSFLTHIQMFPTIELQDPNSNRIGQWLNQTTVGGILDLSYPMNSDATQGVYTITAWDDKKKSIVRDFEIKEYVLPKFEVTVQMPPVITILDTEVTLKVCAKYTYGKAVTGSAKAVVCRNRFKYWWVAPDTTQGPDICRTHTMTTDKTGCGTKVVNLREFAMDQFQYEDTINVDAEVEEFGTGVVLKGSGRRTITSDIVSLSFEDTVNVFKPGLSYEGKIKASKLNNVPLQNEPVYLIVTYGTNNRTVNLVTNTNGMASFSLDTKLWGTESVSLEARYRLLPDVYGSTVRTPTYPSAYLWLQSFYSKSGSFLVLMPAAQQLRCDRTGVIMAQYIIQAKELSPRQLFLNFFYMVMSRGSVTQEGRINVLMSAAKENRGKLTFPLQQMNKLPPYAQVVVYAVLPSGEAIADSMDYPVQPCLPNEVSLKFTNPVELPGGQTSLTLKARPGSLCSVKVIDQSLLLLKPDTQLDITSVFNLLPVQRLSGYPYNIEDEDTSCILRPPVLPPVQPVPVALAVLPVPPTPPVRLARQLPPVSLSVDRVANPVRRRPGIYFPNNRKEDVYNVFKDVGIKLLTNAEIRKPYDCTYPIMFARPGVAYAGEAGLPGNNEVTSQSESENTVRKYFPETWIFDLVPVGDSGVMGVQRNIPDSITMWQAEAFCTSSVGFGIAPSTNLTTFQPFFVSLTLPYSIVRGETFTLKATVFNYLSGCVMVKATLADSQQFTAQPCDGCQYTRCLCVDESWTFSWIVKPSALGEVSFQVSAEAMKTSALCGNEVAMVPDKGRIDTVVQTLLVVAEGTKQTVSINELVCPTGGAVEKTVSLTLPSVFVMNSVSASVSVLGDLMGRALKNLDKLLAMPFGCGEQNMLLFAPNIFILRYLESSGQLTPSIRAKANTFLVSGYQRELTYKHDDGSYSAFGKSDESGNTWLTAFVMKSFGSAKQYIFIDQQFVDQAKAWLYLQQQENGCFASVGKLFHTDMQGGVNDNITLSAYITAALLELGVDSTDPVVVKSLGCLRQATTQLSSTYTSALLSYTFTLAGDQQMRSTLITQLDQQAIVTVGARHWSRQPGGTLTDSLEVEMTSYVLLALLSGPLMPGFDLGYCASIVHWLAQQQNAFGGFASTQDTVVALQALAKYSAATYSPAGTISVTVTSPSGQQKLFTVDQSNRLLYQEGQLAEVPGSYRLRAVGKGCVFIQLTVTYNIPPPADFTSFTITAKATGHCSGPSPSVELSVTVRYNGKRAETNMVILDIKLLSGFKLDESSVKNDDGYMPLVYNGGDVKRVDTKADSVVIYLDGLKRGQDKTYKLVMVQETAVQNLKPAVVKIYDYYETSNVAVTEYTSPC